jgi:hypothetical protein
LLQKGNYELRKDFKLCAVGLSAQAKDTAQQEEEAEEHANSNLRRVTV